MSWLISYSKRLITFFFSIFVKSMNYFEKLSHEHFPFPVEFILFYFLYFCLVSLLTHKK